MQTRWRASWAAEGRRFVGLATAGRQFSVFTKKVWDQLANIVGEIEIFRKAVDNVVDLGKRHTAFEGQNQPLRESRRGHLVSRRPRYLFPVGGRADLIARGYIPMLRVALSG